MHNDCNGHLLSNARSLRKEMTPWERKLWYLYLRRYPIKIYRQRVIGDYIVDFYCSRAGLVVELDGSQHYFPEERAADAQRSDFLESKGLLVLRFSNYDVDRRFVSVWEAIHRAIQARLQ